jgi:hypothetical protein
MTKRTWTKSLVARDLVLATLFQSPRTISRLSDDVCRGVSAVRKAVDKLHKDGRVRIVAYNPAGGLAESAYERVWALGGGIDADIPDGSNLDRRKQRHERRKD